MEAIIKVIKCNRKDTLNKRTFVTAAQSLFSQIIFSYRHSYKVNIKELQTYSRHRILKTEKCH